MTKNEILRFIDEYFGITPDYPWDDSPDAGVFRHVDNRKWFALLMEVKRSSLKLNGDGQKVEYVLNVKANPITISSLREQKGILPAYHMNKEHWLSIMIEEADNGLIAMLIGESYDLTASAKTKRGH